MDSSTCDTVKCLRIGWERSEGKAQLQKVGWDVMVGGTQAELNRRLVEQILPDAHVAVDGLRHTLDYEKLTACFSTSFTLLYLHTDRKERFERLRRLKKYTDLNSFEAADNHPVEQHIESLRTNATALIKTTALCEICTRLWMDLFLVAGKKVSYESLGCCWWSVWFRR